MKKDLEFTSRQLRASNYLREQKIIQFLKPQI